MATRLGTRDRVTLGVFVALWGFCMVMRGLSLSRPAPQGIVARTPAGDYPVIQELTPAGEAPMVFRVGDRLVQMGGTEVRGMAPVRLAFLVTDLAWRSNGEVPVIIDRNGERLVVNGAVPGSTRELRTNLAIALIWGIVAVLILLRAPPTPSTRALFLALASSALLYTAAFRGPPWALGTSIVISLVVLLCNHPLMIRAYLSFPDDVSRLGGRNRYWPWLFAIVGAVIFMAASGMVVLPSRARPWATWLVILYVLTLMVVMTLNYRRSGPVGRRKVKWVVYAIYLGTLISLPAFAIGDVVTPNPQLWQSVAHLLSSVTFPISVLIAVLRFDLFDIDRLIGATVAYNLLGFIAVGAGLLLLPDLTQFLSSALQLDQTVGRSGITLGMAGAVILIQRRVRPHVDRVLFKERFALERAFKVLPERLAAVRTPDELWNLTGSDLVDHLNPEACTIFTVGEAAFVPVFSRGEAVTPAVRSDSDLVRWVEHLDEAVGIDKRAIRGMGTLASALLSGLASAAVIPVHRKGVLEAFICLGEKRSGDIYTATDLALLTALARSLSIHLLRFDEAELLERSRAIQEKMRRYVPGAIAEHIEEGRDLEAGEREVSVLFVDLRGYTAYADGRAAAAIFSTVNRYTEAVSSIVRETGGVVVEFNGDGMMAIFGAPRPLAGKEAAAVRCALRLVAEVSAAGLGEGVGSDQALSVGVGVATGSAFVGNIQAVDRTIWSAIGNTTNLAARLQSLTRDLDASIVIDAATFGRALSESARFVEHAGVAIRGRREQVTIHALPLAVRASTS